MLKYLRFWHHETIPEIAWSFWPWIRTRSHEQLNDDANNFQTLFWTKQSLASNILLSLVFSRSSKGIWKLFRISYTALLLQAVKGRKIANRLWQKSAELMRVLERAWARSRSRSDRRISALLFRNVRISNFESLTGLPLFHRRRISKKNKFHFFVPLWRSQSMRKLTQ